MDSDGNDSLEGLADRLQALSEKGTFDDKDFWPLGCVNAIITRGAIYRELGAESDHVTLNELVDFILEKSKTVFAISLCCNLDSQKIRKAMDEFRVLEFDDSQLPVVFHDIKDSIFYSSIKKAYKEPWNSFGVKHFSDYQWRFLAPVFNEGEYNLDLAKSSILPFTGATQRGGSGTFGEVHEVEIHPAHQKANLPNGARVALKKLYRAYTDDKDAMEKLEAEWLKEVQAHKEITKCGHPNIIKFMTAITRGYERYLMFEWADGGNLREFWTSQNPNLTRTLVRNIMLQLRGLAEALDAIHARGYRHGDIKPENILRMTTLAQVDDQSLDVGTLKICDMGLTKYHIMATQFREAGTSTKFTTWRYEPPEAVEENKAWSRRYDTWSIGCIILEFIVWLLRGSNGLGRFNRKIVNKLGKECHYFEMKKKHGQISSKVHPAVIDTMNSLSQHAECEDGKTALGDLLKIVRTQLLVVALGAPTLEKGQKLDNTANNKIEIRAQAMKLRNDLDKIIKKGNNNEAYWLKGKTWEGVPSLHMTMAVHSAATEESAKHAKGLLTTGSSSLVAPMLTGCSRELNNIWEFPVDNTFALKIVSNDKMGKFSIIDKFARKRCCTCRKLEFWTPEFSIVDSWKKLENDQRTCDFCRLRWELCRHLDRSEAPTVRFNRDQSMLKLNEEYPPVLSLLRGPEMQRKSLRHLQVGRPQLPPIGSQTYYSLLREWLSDCDAEHPECRPQKLGRLPTRLMHLFAHGKPNISLVDTRDMDIIEYTALSHPWGKGPHFCTTLANVEAHQQGIDFERLPATFQHAIVATRELGFEYLWIDSICIVQGEGGDFDQEAKRMEDVFSSASCVLAASSARGQYDGFLSPRQRQRQFLTFDSSPGLPSIYVSPFMDDFNEDVLEASLSKRGWVLQERALARRTIYFTDKQTYWECGKGVRCETLTKMDNKLASFLGDPNFPSKLSNEATSRGEQIRLYEDLYRQYTRLAFTRISDRPIAIAGLEKRLIRNLKAHGGFGVFDDGRSLFQRSLLWQRGQEVPSLSKIHFPGSSSIFVPTWSWMAYDGGIDFLDLPLGGVHWFTDAIRSPWASGGANTWHTGDGKDFVELTAWARPLKLGISGSKAGGEEIVLTYDNPDSMDADSRDLLCVLVGRATNKKIAEDEMVHFLLFITLSKESLDARDGSKVYERVGVGHMKGSCIDLKSPAQAVVIR